MTAMLRENERDEWDAQGWKQSGGDSAGAVSGGDSVEVRVHPIWTQFPGRTWQTRAQ